ncbi:hypothetical protein [Telluria aromaticivorans]|uniref:Glycosyltransferase family 2 protein n=1 Tax=Telluria aromaticivorans TaxID=2725995 RepID=A0A7Y2K2I6_9BURK|nr:hypothetical protein [Telluria aromaticivorans]NNG24229.1 hypothetical protein [Telluria aromaticivorans]
MTTTLISWSIAIFAARETTDTLARCVRAALAASIGRQLVIDVLINGNAELAEKFLAIARNLDCGEAKLRVWSISEPDKAHTWNEYVYRIWEPESITFFIDGYAQVRTDALSAMERRLAMTPDALGATGVPTCGRSATAIREQMKRKGGIHGNLFAISAEGMRGIRRVGFKLPLGIYRTDPLIGSVLMFRLDPANNTWDPRRIAVEPTATWHVDGIEDITWGNVKAHFKRMLRQAQGELENRAAREHLAVQQLPSNQLPLTVADLIAQWLTAQPVQARSLFLKRPLCYYAAWKVRVLRNWSRANYPPELLYSAKITMKTTAVS